MTVKAKPHCVCFLDVVVVPQLNHNSNPPPPTQHCHAATLMLDSLIWRLVCCAWNNDSRTHCTTNWHHCGCLNRDQRCFPYLEVLKLFCLYQETSQTAALPTFDLICWGRQKNRTVDMAFTRAEHSRVMFFRRYDAQFTRVLWKLWRANSFGWR